MVVTTRAYTKKIKISQYKSPTSSSNSNRSRSNRSSNKSIYKTTAIKRKRSSQRTSNRSSLFKSSTRGFLTPTKKSLKTNSFSSSRRNSSNRSINRKSSSNRSNKISSIQKNSSLHNVSIDKSFFKPRTPIKPNKLQLSQYKNIETFFKKSIICGETGECLNFGINRRLDFLLFSSLKENTDLIQKVELINQGDNGSVYFVKFVKTFEEKNKDVNINFSTILKTSLRDTADNLAYEYIVGKYFINEQTEYYPNFLLTYEIFKNKEVKDKTEEDYLNRYDSEEEEEEDTEIEKENTVNSLQSLSDESIPELIKQSCKNPRSIAILTQYFDKCKSLHDFFIGNVLKNSHNKDILYEIHRFWVPTILYQIYFVLSELSNVFTHYDLHTSNVLLYKLPQGKYIKMNYMNDNGEIVTSFKTIYIPKIIDYGRCYFFKNSSMNSKNLYDSIVCTTNECNVITECGEKLGYYFFEYDNNRGTQAPCKYNHYISSALRNKSHDLRLLHMIKKQYYSSIKETPDTTHIKDLLDDVEYDSNYGTKEVFKDNELGLGIYNVNDMRRNLEVRILHTREFKYDLDNHFGTVLGSYTCLGTLNIYEKRSRKMEFIPECD